MSFNDVLIVLVVRNDYNIQKENADLIGIVGEL